MNFLGDFLSFKNAFFVFDSSKGTKLNIDYDLWLICDKPHRSALIKSSMYGIPFEGQDYQGDNKEGGMKGMLGKSIEIFDIHNKQMYKAGLISWMAEGAAFNPSIFLSDYIKYNEIDSKHLQATIDYQGINASGVFTLMMKVQL